MPSLVPGSELLAQGRRVGHPSGSPWGGQNMALGRRHRQPPPMRGGGMDRATLRQPPGRGWGTRLRQGGQRVGMAVRHAQHPLRGRRRLLRAPLPEPRGARYRRATRRHHHPPRPRHRWRLARAGTRDATPPRPCRSCSRGRGGAHLGRCQALIHHLPEGDHRLPLCVEEILKESAGI